jgi:acetyltransferase
MKNLLEPKTQRHIYPVNIRKSEILGLKAYATVKDLPEVPDLAVVATPAKTVPEVVEACGRAGILGLVIISAGFKEIGPEGKALEDKIRESQRRYGLSIVGPNCLGIMRPSTNLNVTFMKGTPKSGNIAFIGQSGAIGSAVLDWAIHENIGLSNFVSIGSMLDVDFGDLIDYFGTDPKTRSILMYVEGLSEARKFMSASRHFARTKPIIVVKAGKFGESARAAASHTGSMTGEDAVYDAAFKRAGMVRVDEIADLFNSAEVLGMQPLPRGPNLAIVTNAGGPGVMATDAILGAGGKVAELSPKTMAVLNSHLPRFWSRGNPIDVLGDAKPDRYRLAVEACLDDDNVDGILVIYTPQAVGDPIETAKAIVELCRSRGYQSKTILTSFMGFGAVEEANGVFNQSRIPTYSTPEQAVRTYVHMYHYKSNLDLLYETPEELPVDVAPPKRPLMVILRNMVKENRDVLNEAEAKTFLEYYNFPVVRTKVAHTVDEAVAIASQIGYPVALKILSPQIVHKTDAGGVVLGIADDVGLREAYATIVKNALKYNPNAEIQGATVQQSVSKKGYEVILGCKTDPLFGPVILFGSGGVGVELFRDFAIGLPPLNQTLARRIMEETKVYQLLKGYRNMQPANVKLLEELMVLFSQMLVDFPELKEVDINPLFLTDREAFAFDARIVVDRAKLLVRQEPHQHLVITPYPRKYEKVWRLRDGRTILLRPIRPEDEPMWLEMFQSFSEETIRYRFFQVLRDTPHEIRVRYCNIDYDREVAIVAEMTDHGKRKLLGVARVGLEPNARTGEIAFVVADPWQGLGIGTKMVDHTIDVCKDMNVESLYAIMLRDNFRAISLMKKMGFEVRYLEDGTAKGVLNIENEESLPAHLQLSRAGPQRNEAEPAEEPSPDSAGAEALAN